MRRRWRLALLASLALVAACSAPPERVEKAADLPRFTYRVPGELEPLVRDPQRFAPLARDLRRDVESDGSRAGWFNANTVGWRTRAKWKMATLTAHGAVPGHPTGARCRWMCRRV